MKYLYSLFAFSFFSSGVFAQVEFAPVGATWYYTYTGFTTAGYEKVVSEKDTSIDSRSYRKLARTIIEYDFLFHFIHTRELTSMYVYDSSDVYYFFQNDHLAVLYDFNKNAGEYWSTDAYSFDGGCGPIQKVYVDSTGLEEINGLILKWLAVHDDGTYGGYFNREKKIYQKMGSFYYLFPAPACVVYEEGWELRCYSDSILQYQNMTCDSLYNTVEEIASYQITITPNPVFDILILQSNGRQYNTKIEIFDLSGRKMKTSVISSLQTEIPVSDLPNGIYFLRAGNDLGKFLKE